MERWMVGQRWRGGKIDSIQRKYSLMFLSVTTYRRCLHDYFGTLTLKIHQCDLLELSLVKSKGSLSPSLS